MPALRFTAVALVAATVVTGLADGGLSRFQLVANNLGTTTIQSFTAAPVSLKGWQESRVAQYDWADRFFGGGSSWIRYDYYGANEPASVLADVVTTGSLSRLQAYGVQACYEFHGYGLHTPINYDLGGGVKGTLLTFHDPKMSGEWNALFWIWAVNTPQGRRYERVVLLAPVQGSYWHQRATPASHVDASRTWLAGFARHVVTSRASAPKVDSTPGVTAAADAR